MKSKLLIPGLLTAGAAVGLFLSRSKIHVGDEAVVPLTVAAANAGLTGVAKALMPTATAVGIKVTSTTTTTVTGVPVSLIAGPTRTPIPTFNEPLTFAKDSVSAVFRDGKPVDIT